LVLIGLALMGSTRDLHQALYERNQEKVQKLLEAYPLIRSPGSWTALHEAARQGYEEIAAILLEKRAELEAREPNAGMTALHLAAMYMNAPVAKLLVQHGANMYAETRCAFRRFGVDFPAGCTPRKIAESRGSHGVVAYLCQDAEAEQQTLARCNFTHTTSWTLPKASGIWPPHIRIRTALPTDAPSPEDTFLLPGFMCERSDYTLMAQLSSLKGFESWHGNRHLGLHFNRQGQQWEPPMPEVVHDLVRKLELSFGLQATACRLNLYRNCDFKPLHHDRPNQMTVSASFGAMRELTLVDTRNGSTISNTLYNGDVYAFGAMINQLWMHGVPKSNTEDADCDERLSLILWGACMSGQSAPPRSESSGRSRSPR
jgi:alkylated DNA repair dioxygenase AlkB